MAICEQCGQEMNTVSSCVADPILIEGVEYAPIPHGRETRFWRARRLGDTALSDVIPNDPNFRCHDCGVTIGGIHPLECDVEECPRCHGQFLSYECGDEFDDDEDKLE